MTHLTIEGWHEVIPTKRDTLLDAALAAGVPVDHQCRAGECGRCRCRLLTGDIRELPAQPGVLDEADRDQGWILACRSVPRTDVTVAFSYRLAAPRPKRQTLTGEVLRCRSVTAEVKEVIIEPERPLDFHAGQYVELEFAGKPARNYSPANPPGASLLTFLIRILPHGLVSSYVADSLAPGAPCRINGPFGSACLSNTPQAPILLAGGGTGLAPMLSILCDLSTRAPGSKCSLYVGVRSPHDLLAKDELLRLVGCMPELDVVPVFSDRAPEGAQQGFVAPVIARRHGNLESHEVFIAGPPPMVETVEREVIRLGALPDRVRSDPFVIQSWGGTIGRRFGLGRLGALFGV